MTTLSHLQYSAHCFVTHVLSEMLRRWIALPTAQGVPLDKNQDEAAEELCHWSSDQWCCFIRDAMADMFYRPFWRYALSRQTKLQPLDVATALVQQFSAIKRFDASYLSFADSRYPLSLRFLSDPPAAVSLQGSLSILKKPAIAVIGARKATAYSFSQSQLIGSLAAQLGCVVVSGGALGCDIAAHKGVMAANLRPFPAVVVMPCGISKKVPRNNAGEFTRLLQGGALFITERLWNAEARPQDFRARNRIIAGLSLIIVLVHAQERSGAMMTVSKGLAEGRDIMVLRAPEHDIRYVGNQKLLADGAPGFLGRDEFMCMLQQNLTMR